MSDIALAGVLLGECGRFTITPRQQGLAIAYLLAITTDAVLPYPLRGTLSSSRAKKRTPRGTLMQVCLVPEVINEQVRGISAEDDYGNARTIPRGSDDRGALLSHAVIYIARFPFPVNTDVVHVHHLSYGFAHCRWRARA